MHFRKTHTKNRTAKFQSPGNTEKFLRPFTEKNKKGGGRGEVEGNQVIPRGLLIIASVSFLKLTGSQNIVKKHGHRILHPPKLSAQHECNIRTWKVSKNSCPHFVYL